MFATIKVPFLRDNGRNLISVCDNPTCQGHISKFNDCVSEALYGSVNLDDADGDSSEYGLWFGIAIFRVDETFEMYEPGTWVTIPAGAYIVTEDSQGFVGMIKYELPCANSAMADFAEMSKNYTAWLDSDSFQDGWDEPESLEYEMGL